MQSSSSLLKGSLVSVIAVLAMASNIRSSAVGAVRVPQPEPKIMTVVVVRAIEPPQEPGSFAAQPKKCWRAGTRYARIEEAQDTANGIHGLLIVNEPDAWLINLLQKSGRHMTDPGPTFNARLPIFDPSIELEFGRELEFFTKKNVALTAGEPIGARSTARYEFKTDTTLILWTDAKSRKPLLVKLTKGNESQTFEYLSYDDNVSFDPSLFRPPAGITIEE